MKAIALFSCAVFLSVTVALSSQARSSAEQQVRQFADLRPGTTEEQTRAAYFDQDGEALYDRKMFFIPSESPPPIPPDPFGEARPPSKQDVLQATVCSASAVVVGHVTAKRALLNRSETFLFTDYTVDVEQWLRPRSGNGRILVSMLGGRVDVAGETYRVDVGARLEFMKPVVLFLKPIPRTTGFALSASIVEVEDGSAKTSQLLPQEPSPRLAVFAEELSAAANRCR